jgi:hypothetical protein
LDLSNLLLLGLAEEGGLLVLGGDLRGVSISVPAQALALTNGIGRGVKIRCRTDIHNEFQIGITVKIF